MQVRRAHATGPHSGHGPWWRVLDLVRANLDRGEGLLIWLVIMLALVTLLAVEWLLTLSDAFAPSL